MTVRVVPSTIRPLSDPDAPLGLVVQDDGVMIISIGDGIGVEIALAVIDAARLAMALGGFAARNAGLDEAPVAGEG